MAGTTHDDVVKDANSHILQSLGDLVGGIDVLLGGVTLLSGVKPHRHETGLCPRAASFPSLCGRALVLVDILIVCALWTQSEGFLKPHSP